MPEQATLITAEEFFLMNLDGVELVRGRIQPKHAREAKDMAPPGFEHGRRATRIASRLTNFVEQRKLGVVVCESGYIVRSDEQTVRGPDVSFVSTSRLPSAEDADGFFRGSPDLAVEILSPGDTVGELEEKVAEYLAAGTLVIWVVSPRLRNVTVYAPGRAPSLVGEGGTLSGEDVLPGFQLKVAEIFSV